MSLYKRKSSPSWYIKFYHNGKMLQQSTGTTDKRLAQEMHDRLKADLWRQSNLGDRPKYSWQDAVLRFIEETTHKRTHLQDVAMLRWLDPHFRNYLLEEINRDIVEAIMKNKTGVKDATINRYLALIRSIFMKAQKEWEWVDRIPSFRLKPEPRERIRWITYQEAARLIEALPPHLADAAEFTLATGLRLSNCMRLQWSQVDLDRKIAWIYADQAKGKKDFAVPLNSNAMKVLNRRHHKHPTNVFTWAGKPIERFDSNTWKRALKKANITDFRWHDLRHTWATWHVMSGTDLRTLMELGGWSSYEMVLRYAHMSRSYLHTAAENINHGY